MKKYLLVIVSLLLMGCESTQTNPLVSTIQIEYSDFDLTVDSKTNVVYIDNKIKIPGEYTDKIYHIYTPYYTSNGRICNFHDGKIKEIIDDKDCDGGE